MPLIFRVFSVNHDNSLEMIEELEFFRSGRSGEVACHLMSHALCCTLCDDAMQLDNSKSERGSENEHVSQVGQQVGQQVRHNPRRYVRHFCVL